MSSGPHAAPSSALEAIAENAREKWQELRNETASYVLLGTATCGRSAGALDVKQAFIDNFSAGGLDVPVIDVGCMGHCYAEPMAVVKRPGYPGMVYHHLTPIIVKNLVQKFFAEEDPYFDIFLGAIEDNETFPRMADLPRYGMEERRLLKRCGIIDPENILDAVADGAYRGLASALEKSPEQCLEMIKDSGLRGLGGAGFLTAAKWEMLKEQSGKEQYLICNADEGDPGAFMDRTILESDPHSVIEGMTIGAHITGAGHGFIYVRAEYPLAVHRMRIAIEQAREEGLLGTDVLGAGLDFEIDVVEGAGAFVCGEETALIASIEGRRGMPRIRPPYPTARGLLGQPTAVNNVKTLASAPMVFTQGPEWFAGIGTQKSKGTAVFALAGKIANPGLVEVPMGTTLRQVIFDIGGGVPHGKAFKAVQIGGPSGGCLPGSMLDTPIDFDSLTDAGVIMGSGGMVVLDQDNCMVDTARYFLEFTKHESCGKCTFCRIGTRHMLVILDRIVNGEGVPEDLHLIEELAEDIKAGSLCNLGRTAPNPVLTTLKYFREEYEEHINEHYCRAKVCKQMTAYYIDPKKCVRSCDACVGSCPPEAIYADSKRIKVVDQDLCVRCNSCVGACPPEYDAVIKMSPKKDVPPSEPRPDKEKKAS
jgi:NADH-quinone oxidoreductase subunit F